MDTLVGSIRIGKERELSPVEFDALHLVIARNTDLATLPKPMFICQSMSADISSKDWKGDLAFINSQFFGLAVLAERELVERRLNDSVVLVYLYRQERFDRCVVCGVYLEEDIAGLVN